MDTDSFIVYIKTDDIYKDIAEDFETKFDTLNSESDKLLPKEINKKFIGLVKNELSGKIMRTIVGLVVKSYSCLISDGSEDKKAKGTKNVSLKENIHLKIIKDV